MIARINRVIQRNLALAQLAIQSAVEYRFNFMVDAVLQPAMSVLIEITLWYAVFKSLGQTQILGFSRERYFAYALWAPFFSRIAVSWMYEFKMIDEIYSGAVNAVLTRPVSFFEYYLSQLLGYKFITTMVSLVFPLVFGVIFHLSVEFWRIPWAILLVLYYMILIHMMGFTIACIAFFLNRAESLTMNKNLALWVLSGELFPLDLMPQPYRDILIHLPFSNGVYVPVGYITGRFGHLVVWQGFLSVSAGILFFGLLNHVLWKQGLKRYTGTGA